MASGDLYELQLRGRCNGQDLLNVFHYLQTGGASGAGALNYAFQTIVMPKIQEILCPLTTLFAVHTKDMADPTDFDINSFTVIGLFNGEAMPTHDAVSFTYVTNRLDARSGGKRFGVYPESSQNGGIPAGVMGARISALEATLESSIVGLSPIDTWRPVIYGKRVGSAGYFSNPLSDVKFLGFTSQNNRKFYTSPGF